MRFSILIPAYNARQYLDECLASIDAQICRDYEVIAVDDGSTDGTGMLLDTWASERNGATVVHKNNEGPLLARRDALARAKGEYVLFLDSDDCLRSDALQIIAEAADRTNADIIAYRLARTADYSQRSLSDDLPEGLYTETAYAFVKAHVLRGRYNNLANKAIKRLCFDTTSDYRPYSGLMHGEDLFQLLPIIDQSGSLVQLDAALYYYRSNNSSNTASFKPQQLEDVSCVAKRLIEYGIRWKLPREAGRCALMQYCSTIKIMWEDPTFANRRQAECEHARLLLSSGPPQVREAIGMLRPDNSMLIRAVLQGHWRAAGLIVNAVDLLKRVPRRGRRA